MANDLASYIVSLDLTLATAIDAATWPDALLTDALRQAVHAYSRNIVYETSFTTIAAGYSHDLSTMTALLDIHALAYPWSDGVNFEQYTIHWRYYDHQKVRIEPHYAAIGEIIRVRHTKIHYLKDLDAAAATTVPAIHAHIVNLAAAAWACLLRQRQITENPGLPREALPGLGSLYTTYLDQFFQALRAVRPSHNPAWSTYGLD